MPRYKLILEYDGTPFVGWQSQADGASVQSALAAAIEKFCGDRVQPKAAGRTDAGVHALGQVAHIDLTRDHPCGTVRDALNFHLRPAPIVAVACEQVPDTFDARFSAKRRHYRYRIVNRRAPLALDRDRAWLVRPHLDCRTMEEAARHLTGHHDFTTFRAAQCQAKSPMRTLDEIQIAANGDEIAIAVAARSFLHHQVRSIAGTLKLVGEGKWRPFDVKSALEARDRSACGAVAPACGLYFVRVDYDDA